MHALSRSCWISDNFTGWMCIIWIFSLRSLRFQIDLLVFFFVFYSIARLVVLIEHVLITSDFKKIKTHFVWVESTTSTSIWCMLLFLLIYWLHWSLKLFEVWPTLDNQALVLLDFNDILKCLKTCLEFWLLDGNFYML